VSRAAAALIAAVAMAVMASGAMTHAAAPTKPKEGCSWHRHSKRVVKQVKRHGRARQVKRVKHWWTCDRQPSASTPDAPMPGPGSSEVPASEEPPASAFRLSVKAVEWSYTLSRPEVSAGEAIVELNNLGEDNHNLKLQRIGAEEPALSVPEASPAKRTSARLTLSPGSYRLYCSLFEHDEKGMHATLVVAGG
jgi:plastocyanin